MDSYNAIASVYESLQKDFDYGKWAKYILKVIKNAPNKVGVDVGAGTGLITRALFNAGYLVTGTDVSYEMLNEAVAQSNGQIPYIQQSAEAFSGFSNLGFVTAVNDVVNYLTPKKVEKFFTKVFSALDRGGIFVFDISSTYKLKNLLGNETFCLDTDDVSYMWFNILKADRVIMDISVFKPTDDGLYERFDERHVQFLHETGFITNTLKNVGFNDVFVTGHLGNPIKNDSLRIVFIAKKL